MISNMESQLKQQNAGDRINEVVFIGTTMDRSAIEQAWKATHLNFTESRKGLKGWAGLPDPFPSWERTEEVETA